MKFLGTCAVGFLIYGAFIVGQNYGSVKFEFKEPKVSVDLYQVTQYKHLKNYNHIVSHNIINKMLTSTTNSHTVCWNEAC